MSVTKKKVLILGNSHLVVFGFRGELIQRLVTDGHEVTVAFPNGPFGEGEKTSEEYGCRFVEVDMNRRGKNPFQDIILLRRYIKLIREVKPDVVLGYTVKCDVYGGIACRWCKTPFLPNITGIGKGLAEGGITQKITIGLYKLAVKKAQCIFFQNESDRQFFVENKIHFRKDVLLPGSGVNLTKFTPLPYPSDDKIVFTYIARVMKAKGIEQFLDAAREIRREYSDTEFHICGYCEEDYKQVIAEAEATGDVKYHGLVNNIVDYERESHCIVLPTFHPEGISNVLLEAAACARPIITTNRFGCKETVDDGVTGFLVKERDSEDLIEKMKRFLSLSNEQKKAMGIAGRAKIEKQFDRNIVVDAYVKEISESSVE